MMRRNPHKKPAVNYYNPLAMCEFQENETFRFREIFLTYSPDAVAELKNSNLLLRKSKKMI